MTVAELIYQLQQRDGKMRVLVRGYESGFEEPMLTTVVVTRKTDIHNAYDGFQFYEDHGKISCLLIA